MPTDESTTAEPGGVGDTEAALVFVRTHGVVLVSAKGPVPRLIDAIAGEPIRGGWWGHPKGREIWKVLGGVCDSEDILVCRLVEGKLTLVHRRLWPALVAAASRLPQERLAQVREEHTASGKHENREIPFPPWVPAEVGDAAAALGVEEALAALGAWT